MKPTATQALAVETVFLQAFDDAVANSLGETIGAALLAASAVLIARVETLLALGAGDERLERKILGEPWRAKIRSCFL
jgi:hypothetical protein